jgi:hypothetical protein
MVERNAPPWDVKRQRGADKTQQAAQNRTRIAQVAARLIAEHGIGDWSLAKRKAARQLGLPERERMPGDDEVEAALREHHALFDEEGHDATLRAQRETALVWMDRLVAFTPVLVGGVAEGWATVHSPVRLDLVADDVKAVELLLINNGVRYRTAPIRHAEGPAELDIDTPSASVRLVVRTPDAARQRPRRDRRGNDETRITRDALAAMLAVR